MTMRMTATELIAALQKFPAHAAVDVMNDGTIDVRVSRNTWVSLIDSDGFTAEYHRWSKENEEEPDYAGGDAHHACRYCRHALAKHNALVGCKRCNCMGTVGECRPQTDAEFVVQAIP